MITKKVRMEKGDFLLLLEDIRYLMEHTQDDVNYFVFRENLQKADERLQHLLLVKSLFKQLGGKLP